MNLKSLTQRSNRLLLIKASKQGGSEVYSNEFGLNLRFNGVDI